MRALCGITLIAGLSGAFVLGIALADEPVPLPKCLVVTGNTYPCGPCTSEGCSGCDEGTCPGNSKLCGAPPFTVELLPGNGYLNSSLSLADCFILFGCKPEGEAQNCEAGSIGCEQDDDNYQVSSTKYTFVHLSGDCGSQPTE